MVRKVIATRLTESKVTVPHFYVAMDCRIDNLLALRKNLKVCAGSAGRVDAGSVVRVVLCVNRRSRVCVVA